jgi:hypothetical protein
MISTPNARYCLCPKCGADISHTYRVVGCIHHSFGHREFVDNPKTEDEKLYGRFVEKKRLTSWQECKWLCVACKLIIEPSHYPGYRPAFPGFVRIAEARIAAGKAWWDKS